MLQTKKHKQIRICKFIGNPVIYDKVAFLYFKEKEAIYNP